MHGVKMWEMYHKTRTLSFLPQTTVTTKPSILGSDANSGNKKALDASAK